MYVFTLAFSRLNELFLVWSSIEKKIELNEIIGKMVMRSRRNEFWRYCDYWDWKNVFNKYNESENVNSLDGNIAILERFLN